MQTRKILSAFLVVVLLLSNFLLAKPAFASGESVKQIALNTLYQGTVENGDMYYSFTLPSDGLVTPSILKNTESSWDIELTDVNGNFLESFNTPSGSTVSGYSEEPIGLKKGTYYVRISDRSYGYLTQFKFQIKFTATSSYEKELNNTFDNANPIQVNTIYKGAIQNGGDQDYFVFTTPADGNVTLSLKKNINCSWNIRLYSLDGSRVYTDFHSGYGSTVMGNEEQQVGLPKGTYVVALDDYSYSEFTDYDFQVKFASSTQYEKEANDSLAEANPIYVNKPYYGTLQNSNDDDFYTFTMPSDGNVTLLMKRNANSSWNMTLYSVDGGEYFSFHSTYGSTATGYSEKQIGLPKGKYIVKVNNWTYAEGVQYNFQVKYSAGSYYEKEWNDSLQSANPIALNAVYKGTMQSDNDDDSYKFSLNSPQQVKISVPRKGGASWNIELFDANGGSINSFHTNYDSTATGNEERTYTLEPGTYYVVMSNWTYSEDVPYELAVWTASDMVTPDQVKVINRTGTYDTITVGGLATGDIVKVYNAARGGTLLRYGTASSTGQVTLNVSQVGQKAGKIYVSVKKAGWTESARTAVDFEGEVSNPLITSQVKIENNKGKPDLMTINSLGTNDVVKVYESNGKLIGVSMPATYSQAAIAFVQLGQTSGKVYVTVTRAGMKESSKIGISFVGEQTTALLASQVVVVNNTGADDTITVKSLKAGDVIRIYDGTGKYLKTVKATSSQVVAYINQLGTSPGYIYVNVQRTGMTISAKTRVYFLAEK